MQTISLGKREIYEFGGFRFDLGERTLERLDGVAVEPLPDKTLQLLAMLVKRRGHLVEKDDILEQIWPDSFVEENNVDRRVSSLRQVLGKTESGGKFIETVRGHGYRFVGRVDVVEVSGTWLPATLRLPGEDKALKISNGDHADTNGSPMNVEAAIFRKRFETFRSSKKLVISSCAVAVAAVVILGYFGFVRTGSARAPLAIAILPAAPMDSAEGGDRFELGIADALISRLASSQGLQVRPLNSVRDYAGQNVDSIAAGRDQKVDYVLESNYQIADGRIRVTGRLYNVASGMVEDSFQNQPQDVADTFGAQDAIAADFGKRLMTRFNVSAIRPAKTRGTTSVEAYRLYQQGMYLIDKRSPTNSAKALEYLEQAVDFDPNYAQAWAAKAVAIRTSGRSDANQIHQSSIESIRKALDIDPNLSDAYSALCTDKLLYDYDFVAAEGACKQAIEIEPGSSAAHRAYSWVLSFHGKHAEAVAEITTAIDLEPVSYINKRDLGNALYMAQRYEEAEAHWLRQVELDSTDLVVYNQLIRTFEAQGKDAEAFEWFIKLLNVLKRDEQGIARYQAAYLNSGWRGVLLERAADPEKGFGYPTDFHIAGLYARAGEKDKAFEYLERSFQRREWAMPQLQVYPQLDSLRDDPRYDDLVRRL